MKNRIYDLHSSPPSGAAAALVALLEGVLIAVLLAGCAASAGIPAPHVLPSISEPVPAPTSAAAAPTSSVPPDSVTPEPSPVATAVPPTAEPTMPPATEEPRALRIAIDPDLAQPAIDAGLEMLKAAGIATTLDNANPDITFGRMGDEEIAGSVLAYERVLVAADRFSTILPGISLAELKAVWSGAGTTPNFTNLYPSEAILGELTALLGPPGPNVKPQPADKIADELWSDSMGLALLPFDALVLRVRALPIDGQSAVDNRFDATSWPLTDRAWLSPRTELGAGALEALAGRPPGTNRDPSKLTVLVMTGVTAIARGTAAAIEKAEDWAFPARVIGPELAAADLTTTSNEISFMDGCEADNTLNNMLFCARYEYWDTLKLSGIDAIGLTGNHNNDFGYDANTGTLEFYKQENIPYYGGGANEEEARMPLILEHNGNKLGFIGANQFGPEESWAKIGGKVSAWAGPDNPGSARFVREQMVEDIRALKGQVDLVFAEVQHTEVNAAGEYSVDPLPQQVADFDALSQAGADVVTGVQAHAPQSMALQDDKLILYGLGNLYFDQTWSWPTRTGVIVRYTIYDGRLLGAELLISVIDPDKQLRWATPAERAQVLKTLFGASGW